MPVYYPAFASLLELYLALYLNYIIFLTSASASVHPVNRW